MSTAAAAWATYVTAVGIIYFVGQRAAELLPDEMLRNVSRYSKDHPVSRTMVKLMMFLLSIVDSFFLFTKSGVFYTPRISRSVIFSLVVLILLVFPFKRYLYIINLFGGLPDILPILPATVAIFNSPSKLFDPPFVFIPWTISTFIITNIFSDFISFSKTRTLLELFSALRTPARELSILSLDFILSVVICIVVGLTLTVLPYALLLIITKSITSSGASYYFTPILYLMMPLMMSILLLLTIWFLGFILRGTVFAAPLIVMCAGVIAVLVGSLAVLTLRFGSEVKTIILLASIWMSGIFIFSLATSFGITILSILVALLEVTRWVIWRFENKNIWKILNFETKPAQASAVVLIVMFTVFYWPIVIMYLLL